jgi:hypothetical protein
MPPLNTHLVIGERVFHQQRDAQPMSSLAEATGWRSHYGYFLLGCLLVDVNSFSNHVIDRRVTHFVGRFDEDGVASFTKSCVNFLEKLSGLLKRPWGALTEAERAFVIGYLCHLAADETWKAWGAELRQVLKIASFAQLPVPPDVILTAFSVISDALYQNFTAVDSALSAVSIPDVFTHVSPRYFQTMWTIIQPALKLGDQPASYFMMLESAQTPATELQAIRETHAMYWDEAVALIQQLGGVEPFLHKAVAHTHDVLAGFERRMG